MKIGIPGQNAKLFTLIKAHEINRTRTTTTTTKTALCKF